MPLYGMWEYMYAWCVFFLWVRLLRVLSVSRKLGPLVIIVIRMGQDISSFAVIYGIFLIAFGFLIRGSMPGHFNADCSYIPTVEAEEAARRKGTDALLGEDSELSPEPDWPVKCFKSWFIVRAFIQAAFGEPFLKDMKTDAAVFAVMGLWVVMNLIL